MASDHDAEALTYSAVLKTFAAASRRSELAGARPGQMWKCLIITGRMPAGRVLASPLCGKFRTAWVEMRRDEGSSDDNGTVEKVLAQIKGLRYLSLAGVNRHFDSALLSLPSLEGLTNLDLHFPFYGVASTELRPSFHLRTLSLGYNFDSPEVVRALFTSSSSTLSSLALRDIEPSLYPSILSYITLLTGHLSSLSLSSFDLSFQDSYGDTPFPRLASILATFPRLTHLSL